MLAVALARHPGQPRREVVALAGATARSLNVEGSFQHVLTDLYGFIGTAIAAALILLGVSSERTRWSSLLIAGLITRSGSSLVKDSGRMFLEAAPRGSTPSRSARRSSPSRASSRSTTCTSGRSGSGFPALSAHMLVAADSDCHAARAAAMAAMLRERFGLEHATLQVEHSAADCWRSRPSRSRAGRR